MKKVTIMIPTYNQPQYIEQCIESAMAQDYQNIEIIISDDSTNDETEKIIKEKFIDDPRIKYFHNENRLGRVGNYHHTLYEKATGDYVLNLDGDDWLLDPHYISEAVEVLNQHEDVVCTIAGISYFHEDDKKIQEGNVSFEPLNFIDEGNKYLSLLAQRKVGFNHLTVLYRREEALKLDFYSVDSTWTDSLSVLKLICGRKMAFFNKSVGVWRIHANNESQKFYETLSFNDLFFHDEYIASFYEKINGKTPTWLNESLYHNMKHYSLFLLSEKNFLVFLKYMGFLIFQYPLFSLYSIPKFMGYILLKIFRKIKS